MTHLKELSNAELVVDTKKSVLRERRATLAVLERLREIHRRGVHIEMGYSSLHEFCVVELSYSDGAAYRRIQAMRLCEELPQAREAISDGSLSLTTAASLERYLTKDAPALSSEAKCELLNAVQGKSKSECERIFYPERTGRVLEFHADDETFEDLTRMSELLGVPLSDLGTLIKQTARIARRSIDPIMKKTRRASRASLEKLLTPKERLTASPEKLLTPKRPTTSPEKLYRPTPRTRVPAATKKLVWTRDGSQCTFVNALTKHRCASRYGLQLDHVIPVACGGTNDPENLRLLCFAHNQLAARRVFGRAKMNQYGVHGIP